MVTRLSETKRLRLVSPQILADRPPTAEVHVGREALTVSLFLPQLEPSDARVAVTANSLRIASHRDASRIHFIIPLPSACEPGRFVLRHKNGVYEAVLQRRSE